MLMQMYGKDRKRWQVEVFRHQNEIECELVIKTRAQQ